MLYKKFKLDFTSDRSKKYSDVKAEKFPLLSDLEDLIIKAQNQIEFANYSNELKTLELRISRFTKQGIYSYLWNKHTNITIDIDKADIVCFNMQQIKKLSESISAAQTFLVISYIESVMFSNRAAKRPFTIKIDEVHLLASKNNLPALAFISEMYKRIRKYNGYICVATQNIKDFTDKDKSIIAETTAIINACQYM
jgi:type IV secretory pathway VirB4 component